MNRNETILNQTKRKWSISSNGYAQQVSVYRILIKCSVGFIPKVVSAFVLRFFTTVKSFSNQGLCFSLLVPTVLASDLRFFCPCLQRPLIEKDNAVLLTNRSTGSSVFALGMHAERSYSINNPISFTFHFSSFSTLENKIARDKRNI